MALPRKVWKFGLTDLLGDPIGEVLNAYERKLVLPLNGLPIASFRIRLDDPLAQEISDRDGDCLLKVYRSTTLEFIGEIMSVEEGGPVREAEGVTLTVTAAGPLWRLQKRLVGTPYPPGASPGLSPPATGAYQGWLDTPANTIISDIINQANTNWDTGIRLGTLDTLYATSIGMESSISLKPIGEVLSDLQGAKIAYPITTPPAYVVHDTFGGSGSVSGRTDDEGNTWTSSGVASDWTVTSGSAGRTTASDASGRLAISSAAAHTNAVVGLDFYSNVDTFGLSGGYDIWLYARLAGHTPGAGVENTGTWIRAQVSFDSSGGKTGYVYVQKRVTSPSPAISELARYSYTSPAGFEENTWYSVRLLVQDTGDWTVWLYPTAQANVGGGPTPIMYGQNDDLATGGQIASGKMAWGDENVTAFTIARSFDNPFQSLYTGPQSFDYEIAPQEPAADAVPYPGSMPVIGELNVVSQIGTTRDNAIFEYGTGSRSARSYKRVINREGMVTKAYVLPPGFPDDSDIRTTPSAFVSSNITARGLLEEVVPTDASDSQLRQAWADANERIRGGARQIITFEPSSTAPEFGTDYIVGDFITGRAKVNGSARFNALFRVYAVEINVDENGKADVIPTLVVE